MTSVTDADARELLAGRLVDGVTQAMEPFSVYLGVELGYYRALAEQGPATETDLASHAGIAVRYAREWLEQQAVAGSCTATTPGRTGRAARFRLPAGTTAVLVDPRQSLTSMAPMAQVLAGVAGMLPQLLEAFRTGGGVAYADYGSEMRDGHRGRQPAACSCTIC